MISKIILILFVNVPMAPPGLDGGVSANPTGDSPATEVVEEKVTPEEDEEENGNDDVPNEMEELRHLEETEVTTESVPPLNVRGTLNSLGYGNPLRHHLSYATEHLGAGSVLSAAPSFNLFTNIEGFDISQLKATYDIPVEMHPMVQKYIQFFVGRGRQWFARWISRSTRYIPLFQPILQQHGLPKDTVFLSMIESGFSPNAYSWAHAAGPWQFISSTGKTYQLKQDFWVDERRDPIKSTHAASRFLMHLYQDLGNWHLAWAAYNSGGARVRRVMNKKGTSNFWALSEGRGLPKETKHYVPKLIAAAIVTKHYREFGFREEEFDYQEPLSFDEVKVDAAVDLDVLARLAGATPDEIRELNPELKRWCTPPSGSEAPYTLRVPWGRAGEFQEAYAKLDTSLKLNFVVHKVNAGDTLSKIAAKNKTLPEIVMRLNGLTSPKALKLGTELAIPVLANNALVQEQAKVARNAGFLAPRPEDEVPAGIRRKTAQGSVTKESVDGKTRITYGVAAGDSLWIIGQKFGCSVEDLKRWNGLSRRSKLQIGQALTIWSKGSPAPVTKNNSGRTRRTTR